MQTSLVFLSNLTCQLYHYREGSVHLLTGKRLVLVTVCDVNINGVMTHFWLFEHHKLVSF